MTIEDLKAAPVLLPSVTFKDGVKTHIRQDVLGKVVVGGVHEKIFHAIALSALVYAHFQTPMCVTSLCDGKHSAKSLHYSGRAVDLRIWNIQPPVTPQDVREAIAGVLGKDFDVLLEKDHIHIEYDPKERANGRKKV